MNSVPKGVSLRFIAAALGFTGSLHRQTRSTSYSENGIGGNARPHPGPLPQERGKHAQFPEFSRPLVWNCFMGTNVGCYSLGGQCAKFFREFLHRGEGRGGKKMWPIQRSMSLSRK